ncbi:MAG: SsrA-binding protein SmpB [Acidobacteriota bacterium]
MSDDEKQEKLIADNRKAGFEYHILDTWEAGIVLKGTEVKSIREGGISLRESFCKVMGAEIFLWNAHIAPYSHRGSADHEPTRTRKLLLKRQEINKLIGKTVEKGLTLVPLRMYFKKGKIKLAIALARGKNVRDKRETVKRREADRETRAAVKSRIR